MKNEFEKKLLPFHIIEAATMVMWRPSMWF